MVFFSSTYYLYFNTLTKENGKDMWLDKKPHFIYIPILKKQILIQS